jgi:hypothetical protein
MIAAVAILNIGVFSAGLLIASAIYDLASAVRSLAARKGT